MERDNSSSSRREKKIMDMVIDARISRILAARNLHTAKDVLLRSELELMELMDVPLSVVSKAIAQISEQASPPCQTALWLLKERVLKDPMCGHFATRLDALDKSLCGGIPVGAVTEIVGPAGIGKTQLCLKLSVLAAMPQCYGGLDGNVLYIDTENKFNSRRMIEIAKSCFPDVFCKEGMMQQLAARVLVLQLSSAEKLTERFQEIETSVSQHNVKLLILDSMAALFSREYWQEHTFQRYDMIGHQASWLKNLAETTRIPVVVTNQVRSQNLQDKKQLVYAFQARKKEDLVDSGRCELSLTAALGTAWAHAMNIRLILESYAGQRLLKISKSPFSRNLVFSFTISVSGIQLQGLEAMEVTGDDITSIHHAGYEGVLW